MDKDKEFLRVLNTYLEYCIIKQLPPTPSYSSDIYRKEVEGKETLYFKNALFNRDLWIETTDVELGRLLMEYSENKDLMVKYSNNSNRLERVQKNLEVIRQKLRNLIIKNIEIDLGVTLLDELYRLYIEEVELNIKLSKKYEERDTIIPKSKFENLLWSSINNYFQILNQDLLLTESIWPIADYVVEGEENRSKLGCILILLFFVTIIIYIFWDIFQHVIFL